MSATKETAQYRLVVVVADGSQSQRNDGQHAVNARFITGMKHPSDDTVYL